MRRSLILTTSLVLLCAFHLAAAEPAFEAVPSGDAYSYEPALENLLSPATLLCRADDSLAEDSLAEDSLAEDSLAEGGLLLVSGPVASGGICEKICAIQKAVCDLGCNGDSTCLLVCAVRYQACLLNCII